MGLFFSFFVHAETFFISVSSTFPFLLDWLSAPSSSSVIHTIIFFGFFIKDHQPHHLFFFLSFFSLLLAEPPCCLPCYCRRVEAITAATVLLSHHLMRWQKEVEPSVPPARPPFLYSSTFVPLAACRRCCCSTKPSVELHLQAPFFS